MEQRERETIANAFETYSRWYGKESADEVKELVDGDPSDFTKKPKWPSYSERTKTGPLEEDPIQVDIDHVTGLRQSSLQRCENPQESEHVSMSLPSGSSRCDLSSQGAPDIGDPPAAAAKADSKHAACRVRNEQDSPQKKMVLSNRETSLEAEHLLAITTDNSTSTKD
jgi:hypothetical protein